MASSVEQIVNQALTVARRTRRIADIYEGSQASIIALELYGQARDELLDLKDWSFNRRVGTLNLLKGPPPAGGYSPTQPWSNIYPYSGFLYEYAYPADCLDLRAVIAPPGPMPDLDPLPALWRVDNDTTPNVVNGVAVGPEAKVIFCNITNAMAVYRSRVTDPNIFDAGFTAALVATLGKRIAEAFGADVNTQREDGGEAAATVQIETDVRG